MRILLSRTDSIGDVVLTLPTAHVIKKHFPEAEVLFMGRTYTQPIIERCSAVDQFVNWDDIENLSQEDAVRSISELNCDTCIHVFPRKNIAGLAKIKPQKPAPKACRATF